MSHQEVPEEPCLVEVTQPDHVIHTIHGGWVHGPDGILFLLVDFVLLKACYERVNIMASVIDLTWERIKLSSQ